MRSHRLASGSFAALQALEPIFWAVIKWKQEVGNMVSITVTSLMMGSWNGL
jgi:hypothetical protein